MRLAHCEPAYRVAGQFELGDLLHVLDADVVEHSPLIYSEQHLSRVHRVVHGVILCERSLAALEPAIGPVAGALDIFAW